MKIKIEKLSKNELWEFYGLIIKRLKELGCIRTRNITGERGEQLVINFYNNQKHLPKLQLAPPSTQNVDALSKKGERYAIKTIKEPNSTTGVFYGIDRDINKTKQKFEYLIIVIIDDLFQLHKIIEIRWDIVIKYIKWHSRVKAYNISLTKDLVKNSRFRYEKKK
ncbi:hypothetical protein ACFLZ1_01270 [Patescibacteria group bacterium]